MSKAYIDLKKIEEVPNKYNLHPKDINKLVVLDWDRLKEKTWYNNAMKSTGSWWCHLEGCNNKGQKYDDWAEFWIGFNETNGKVRYSFTVDELYKYNFSAFYSPRTIETRFDMQVQVNAMRFLNELLDEKIVKIGDAEV